MKKTAQQKLNHLSGQALAELCVCLVVFVVLLSALIQISSLGISQTESMSKARIEAGERAISEFAFGTLAPSISDWDEGPDQSAYTADDRPKSGGSGTSGTLAGYSVASASDWDAAPTMQESLPPNNQFLFVKGSDNVIVPVIPAMQHLVYGADTIEIKSEVWMPLTKGIY